jgi:hypothetical protein
MFSKSFFNGWQDVKLYLILILILLLVLSVEHVYFIPAALILAAAVIYYTRRGSAQQTGSLYRLLG